MKANKSCPKLPNPTMLMDAENAENAKKAAKLVNRDIALDTS